MHIIAYIENEFFIIFKIIVNFDREGIISKVINQVTLH